MERDIEPPLKYLCHGGVSFGGGGGRRGRDAFWRVGLAENVTCVARIVGFHHLPAATELFLKLQDRRSGVRERGFGRVSTHVHRGREQHLGGGRNVGERVGRDQFQAFLHVPIHPQRHDFRRLLFLRLSFLGLAFLLHR